MKNYITLGLLCLFSNLIFSQITLEHSYTGNSQLLYSGYKFSFNTENDIYFYTYDSSSNSIDIYNSSHTLYKTVSLPFTNTAYLSIFFPTDKLFNNDNLIEFIAMAYSNSGTSSMQLINEDGTVLYDFGDKNRADLNKTNSSEYKLITSKSDGVNIDVYGLTGTLSVIQETQFSLKNIYPNPANESINIPNSLGKNKSADLKIYSINGQEIISKKISTNNEYISIDISNLSSGVYIYELNGVSVRFIKK